MTFACVFISVCLLALRPCARADPQYHNLSRPPPHLPPNPLGSPPLFSDHSHYLRLGDAAGSTIAVADFTADRYTDLVVVSSLADRPRSVSILPWHQHSYSFQPPPPPSHPSFSPIFSLASLPSLPPNATVASATPIDANADGLLDLLLVVRLSALSHVGVLLQGDGTGSLKFLALLPDLSPYLLVLDANHDMLSDLFFITPQLDRVFYINHPPASFTRHVWRPWASSVPPCLPSYPTNSNAFVDIDGDCAPDLLITSSCGIEVWLNRPSTTLPHNFHRTTAHPSNILLLNHSVWNPRSKDAFAAYADFNADGSLDIAVHNPQRRTIRISYALPTPRPSRRHLCVPRPDLTFHTRVALHDVPVSATNIADTIVHPIFRVGDFNYDGLADLLLLDADTGTVALYAAHLHSPKSSWFAQPTWHLAHVLARLLFPITDALAPHPVPNRPEVLRYIRYTHSSILHHLEDPLAATFFDLAESGRQDILVAQRHGTRLIWNNYPQINDAVFFKATGVNVAANGPPSSPLAFHPLSSSQQRPFSPLPGNTFKVSYGGRYRRETHVCTQCPQSSVLSLQSCSCLFGITRIANYIEEMAMGGSDGVRSWMALMPNALAIVWPQRVTASTSSPASVKWRVSYLSKGRDGQMKKVVLVLFGTLAVLFIVIVYIHSVEKREVDSSTFGFGYT